MLIDGYIRLMIKELHTPRVCVPDYVRNLQIIKERLSKKRNMNEPDSSIQWSRS